MSAIAQPLLHKKPRLLPCGDRCLIVEFGSGLDLALNRHACAFARQVMARKTSFITDAVPTFTGVGLHYKPEALLPLPPGVTPLAALEAWVQALLTTPADDEAIQARMVEIPVCYGGEYGPDLDEAARYAGLSPDALAAQHTEVASHVFMLGFAPGLPYMGLWSEAFALPRRSTPRTRVPAGTVAIANRQCVIYPFDLPGGWHLIGRTPLRMFDPLRKHAPALLAPGDQVRFRAITAKEFMDHAHE